MNIQAVKTISKLRKVNQADIARMAHVSRQAVSRWFKPAAGSEVSIKSPHLKYLADGLHVSAEDLLRPLPVLGDTEVTRRYEIALLWDGLYSDLADFSVGLVRGELSALARLVQVFGLYQASKIAGQKVWNRFPDYKRHIRPVRREQMECLWRIHKNPVLI